MAEKIKISLIKKTTSETKVKKVIPSMKLNVFRFLYQIGILILKMKKNLKFKKY